MRNRKNGYFCYVFTIFGYVLNFWHHLVISVVKTIRGHFNCRPKQPRMVVMQLWLKLTFGAYLILTPRRDGSVMLGSLLNAIKTQTS